MKNVFTIAYRLGCLIARLDEDNQRELDDIATLLNYSSDNDNMTIDVPLINTGTKIGTEPSVVSNSDTDNTKVYL